MSFLTLLLFAVAGGLWRRVMGGWLGIPRWLCFVASPVCLLPVLQLQGPYVFAGAALLAGLYWAPGHDFGDDRALLRRYGPFGLAWTVCRRYWLETGLLNGRLGWSEAAELLVGFLVYLSANGLAWALA